MQYITGKYALNIDCELETPGDWHSSALNWNNIVLMSTQNHILKDYGIESDKSIPEHTKKYNVANHIRAILDLMIQNDCRYLKGFRNDFICTDKYELEFFNQVMKLKILENWKDIDELMNKEYLMKWIRFKEVYNGLES